MFRGTFLLFGRPSRDLERIETRGLSRYVTRFAQEKDLVDFASDEVRAKPGKEMEKIGKRGGELGCDDLSVGPVGTQATSGVQGGQEGSTGTPSPPPPDPVGFAHHVNGELWGPKKGVTGKPENTEFLGFPPRGEIRVCHCPAAAPGSLGVKGSLRNSGFPVGRDRTPSPLPRTDRRTGKPEFIWGFPRGRNRPAAVRQHLFPP